MASFGDASEIADLSKYAIEEGLGWRWTNAKVNRSISDRSTNVVVARIGSKIAGFGVMRYYEKRANLDLLAVKETYRRRGIGTKIVKWLEKVANTAGIINLYVQVREKNTIAIEFYSNLGYEIIDIRKGYYRGKESAVIMYRYP